MRRNIWLPEELDKITQEFLDGGSLSQLISNLLWKEIKGVTMTTSPKMFPKTTEKTTERTTEKNTEKAPPGSFGTPEWLRNTHDQGYRVIKEIEEDKKVDKIVKKVKTSSKCPHGVMVGGYCRKCNPAP